MMTVLPESMVSGWPSFPAAKRRFQNGSREAGRLLLAEEAEHAKGFVERDFKEYFQFYPWGRCPESLQADLASHFAAAVESGAELLNCIARSLPEAVPRADRAVARHDSGSEQSMLRVLHYPAVPTGRSVCGRPLMRTLTYSPCCPPRTALGSSCNCAVASGFPCRILPAN
ncbi:MAG: hypothetical protein CM15mP84_09820 [Cellvibrionales bacterium]|nr:MAG: hypothetical protein CM15mP84_09820 [Cellvibrionales bacterium]